MQVHCSHSLGAELACMAPAQVQSSHSPGADESIRWYLHGEHMRLVQLRPDYYRPDLRKGRLYSWHPCKSRAAVALGADISNQDWILACKVIQLRPGFHSPAVTPGMHAGLVQPHPNCGCVLTSPEGRVLAEAFQQAQVQLRLYLANCNVCFPFTCFSVRRYEVTPALPISQALITGSLGFPYCHF